LMLADTACCNVQHCYLECTRASATAIQRCGFKQRSVQCHADLAWQNDNRNPDKECNW